MLEGSYDTNTSKRRLSSKMVKIPAILAPKIARNVHVSQEFHRRNNTRVVSRLQLVQL